MSSIETSYKSQSFLKFVIEQTHRPLSQFDTVSLVTPRYSATVFCFIPRKTRICFSVTLSNLINLKTSFRFVYLKFTTESNISQRIVKNFLNFS